ncbi:hypothetical protein B0H63DRAFT_510518 [Podospora didyma]|uniref:Rhodopsin domain-containing protein n=1 Tax=Podospora didyma TaxID=330526 RepID=A0AAE0NQT6_9PEZI|nr:hypothetical protein B0H63DRAFT_510518 [Podospora didyma]
MAALNGFQGELPGLPVTDLQVHNGRVYTGVISVLFGLSSLLLTTRIVSRWKSSPGLVIDDYFIIAAAVLGLVDMATIISSVAPVLGTARPIFLPFSEINRVAPLSIVAELTSTWSVALLKTSIALMLLRLQHTRGWTRFLSTVIGVQILTAIFATIMHTTRCIPIQSLWDPTIARKRCWDDAAFKASLTAVAVLIITTDVIFALIPLSFLRHMRRPIRDRITIGVLMSLGLLASAASIAKTVVVQNFDPAGDTAGIGLSIALWASVEAQVGIIAACIPCLRGAFGRFLVRAGIAPREGSSLYGTRSTTWPQQHHQGQMGMSNLGGTGRGGGGGKRASTRIAALGIAALGEQSDEDILVLQGGGRSRRESMRPGRTDSKTDIEVELVSRPNT